MAMLPSIRDVASGVWRSILGLWIWDVATSGWYRIRKAWVWSGTAWEQFYAYTAPELTGAGSLIASGQQTGAATIDWTTSGDTTGHTLTIERRFTAEAYVTVYTGADGGSSPQTVAYWGSNFIDPAAAGENVITESYFRISLKDGGGVDVAGSPAILYPPQPT